MQEKKGPVFINPLQSTDVPNILKTINVYDKLGYVFEAIKETKIQLNDRVPLIGFAGAPWTLLAYMIEGGGSKTLSKAKSWLYGSPDVCHELLNSITNVIVDYLIGQVNAGADCLQVFDSWGGELTPRMFQEFSLPYLEIIAKKVKLGLGDKAVPMIVFAKGAHASLNKLDKIGYDCVSLDWSIDVDQVDLQVAVQGNADPGLLYAPDEEIKKRVNEMMTSFKGKRHVVNLGHGMCPDHEPEKLKVFLEAVKSHQY